MLIWGPEGYLLDGLSFSSCAFLLSLLYLSSLFLLIVAVPASCSLLLFVVRDSPEVFGAVVCPQSPERLCSLDIP